jgi:hypothetical protein
MSPIEQTDLKEYKSLNALSDGGAISATEITPGVDNNLWPDISGAQAAAGGTDYRKTFRKNTHGSLTWKAVQTYIKQQPQGATVSIGVGINHADDADALQGNMTAFSAGAKVALISDGADVRTATILGEVSGVYTTENVVLTGASEVLSVATFTKVYTVYLSALDGSRTVTVKQGAGGTTRGTIGPNKKLCFLWRTGADIDTRAEGFMHGDIAVGGIIGVWFKRVWPAGTTAVSTTSEIARSEGDTDA